MNHAMNLSLNDQVFTTLELLSKKLHTSPKKVVEQAIVFYAKEKIKNNRLMELAGTLNNEDAKEMLSIIKASRVNKSVKYKL